MNDIDWSPATLARVKEMRLRTKTMSEMGSVLTSHTRLAKPNAKPGNSPKTNRLYNSSGQLTGTGEQLHSSWRFSQPNGKRLFIYRGNETTPTYTFKREDGYGTNWVGHGVYAMSRGLIFGWVNRQLL